MTLELLKNVAPVILEYNYYYVCVGGGLARSLLKTIRKRQLQFLGHINRADRLE